MLLGLILVGLFVAAGSHAVLHGPVSDQPEADCAQCFLPATETPEVVGVPRLAERVACVAELEDEDRVTEWDWSASDPRAPPVCVLYERHFLRRRGDARAPF